MSNPGDIPARNYEELIRQKYTPAEMTRALLELTAFFKTKEGVVYTPTLEALIVAKCVLWHVKHFPLIDVRLFEVKAYEQNGVGHIHFILREFN